MQAASSAGGARAGAADAPPAAREPNAYEARIARLIASLPPEEVSTDLRALGEARALVRAGVDALTDAAAALPALAQGAVDLFRGLALQDAVSGSRGVTIDVSSMERAIRRAGGAPYELDGRMKLDVLRAALLQSYANLALARFMQVQARGEVLGSLAAELERAKAWLGAVVAYWCQPGRAQAAAARLAALGVRGGEGVAADVVAVLLQAQTGGEMTVRGRLVWALMEQTCAACPLALTTAANLAVGLLETDAPQAYATALNALQRADAAGHDFQAARLLTAAALALFERARRLLDASRSYMPRTLWRQVDAGLRINEDDAAARVAEHGGGASLPIRARTGISKRLEERRVCSGCSLPQLEARQCGRCRAVWYCSSKCQKEHWPEHKKACKEAARRGA